MLGNKTIKVMVEIDNNTDALKTIRTLRTLDGFKGMKFNYREKFNIILLFIFYVPFQYFWYRFQTNGQIFYHYF